MVLLFNTLFFVFSFYFYLKIKKFSSAYAEKMSRFIVLLGISTFFGGIGHTVHYQLGHFFFNTIVFLMNASSLFAVYFLFGASYGYHDRTREAKTKLVYLILAWIVLMLLISWINANFLLIKIHAAVVLLYTLFVHYQVYSKTKERGNELLILGILVSFTPILVHTMHLSLYEWFNHKDLAHLLMIISLVIIYNGLKLNVQTMDAELKA